MFTDGLEWLPCRRPCVAERRDRGALRTSEPQEKPFARRFWKLSQRMFELGKPRTDDDEYGRIMDKHQRPSERPLGKTTETFAIFKNGSHIINDPVKCKMFCQKKLQTRKKKKPAIHFVILREKKYNYYLNFIIHCKLFFKWHFPKL